MTVASLSDTPSTLGPDSLRGVSITFVNMPLREGARPNVAPEGPAILAAVLRQYGAEPAIIDLNAYRLADESAVSRGSIYGRHLTFQEAEDLLLEHFSNKGAPDIVAFSGMITTLRWQREMAKRVRRNLPDCFLISGNGLATEIKLGLFQWIPELDAICSSEGDDVVLSIAHDVKQMKQYGLKQAILARKLSRHFIGDYHGKERFFYQGDRPKDLSSLPFPAWDLLERDPHGNNILEQYIRTPIWGMDANNSSAAPFKMNRSLNTVSSRGCPYACAFCYRGSQGERNYGMRTAEHLAEQLRNYVEQYQLDFVGFVDDNFAVDKRRISALPVQFEKEDISIRWGTHTRMDEADDRTVDMARAGCVYIGFGAESAAEKTLTEMDKGGFILKRGLTPTKVDGRIYDFPTTMVEAIINCYRENVHANCTWIMGYPGETLDDLKTSAAFIVWQEEMITKGLPREHTDFENKQKSINRRMFTATAYPGTAMFKDVNVRTQLNKNFGIEYDNNSEPIVNEAFLNYVLELDDATKVLHNKHGEPLYFGAMPLDTFLKARECSDSGQTEKILSL